VVDHDRPDCECFISAPLVGELSEGQCPNKTRCLELLARLPRLEVNEDVLEIAEVYWTHRLMPRLPVRDALHWVVASPYHMDNPPDLELHPLGQRQ